MRHYAFIFCLLTGFFLSSAGTAQPYFGVGAGLINIDEGGVDDDAFTGMIYTGYKINNHFSLELSYLHSDSLDYQGVLVTPLALIGIEDDLDVRAWTPAIHVHHQFNQMSVFALIGLAFWDAELRDLDIDDDDSDLSFGIGAEFQPSDSWSVRGQWRRIDADGDVMEGDADFFLLGLHRYF